jgi:hypothetical protein
MQMTAYEVTASNAFFWQKLAVEAADAEAAAKAFRAYLAAPAQQTAEAYELEQAQKTGSEDADELNPASYRYRFKDDAVEESDDEEARDTVSLIGSGGNG